MNHLKVKRNGSIYDTKKKRHVKTRSDGRGYLCCDIDGKTHKVHKIVCTLAHGPKPSDKHLPMHRNNVKTDNRICNLFWGTRSENAKHAHESGAMKSNKKKRVALIHNETQKVIFDSVNKAAKFFKLSPGTIASAASGKSKTAAGLRWEYV